VEEAIMACFQCASLERLRTTTKTSVEIVDGPSEIWSGPLWDTVQKLFVMIQLLGVCSWICVSEILICIELLI
jgi:hypothetical protein